MAYETLLEAKDPLVDEAIEACPWLTTDHMGERRYNYCTWCEGYVTGAVACDSQEHIGFLRAQAHAADQHIQKARQLTNDENVKAELDRAHVRVFEIHTGTGNA